jgi:hypothetical protein
MTIPSLPYAETLQKMAFFIPGSKTAKAAPYADDAHKIFHRITLHSLANL